MKFKTLGRTGVQVSMLCLGTMTFGKEADEAASAQIYRRCREAGIQFIDTANVYVGGRSEEILGQLIEGERDELIIASKFFGKVGPGVNDRGCSRRHLRQAVEESLRRLRSDRLDLYYVHQVDPLTPIEETLRGLDDLVRAGKILYPAVSNFAAWQIVKALGISAREHFARFECVQPMYNLVKRQVEVELLPMAASEGLAVVPYNPLAAGLLSGKYRRGSGEGAGRIAENAQYRTRYDDPEYYETAEKFVALCGERGWNPVAVAVAWVASHPAVTAAIIGARNVEQLNGSLGALDFAMTPEIRAEIAALSKAPPLATDRREEQFSVRAG
ncbi:MAG: aldo/keto reductase [Verrucomicrobia bacterium]|nr:aldo/keto reductase [Verrucomicrobiota bacterium]MBV9656705.1 aldo/keto reductase [Verrucomicrobiota bacterium]